MESKADKRRTNEAPSFPLPQYWRDANVAEVSPFAFTVPEFCEAHRISRALFYILQRDGNGPRVMKCGRRTLIARESAEAWRRQMEAS